MKKNNLMFWYKKLLCLCIYYILHYKTGIQNLIKISIQDMDRIFLSNFSLDVRNSGFFWYILIWNGDVALTHLRLQTYFLDISKQTSLHSMSRHVLLYINSIVQKIMLSWRKKKSLFYYVCYGLLMFLFWCAFSLWIRYQRRFCFTQFTE